MHHIAVTWYRDWLRRERKEGADRWVRDIYYAYAPNFALLLVPFTRFPLHTAFVL